MRYANDPLPNETILWAPLAEGYQALIVVSQGHAGMAVRSPVEDEWNRKRALQAARGRCREAQQTDQPVVYPYVHRIRQDLETLALELRKILSLEKIEVEDLWILNLPVVMWQGTITKTWELMLALEREADWEEEDDDDAGCGLTDDLEEF